tara:strand:+ start:3626 stop:3808 length:183 start_codon:yes stop_codon:yes gene_type:complete
MNKIIYTVYIMPPKSKYPSGLKCTRTMKPAKRLVIMKRKAGSGGKRAGAGRPKGTKNKKK